MHVQGIDRLTVELVKVDLCPMAGFTSLTLAARWKRKGVPLSHVEGEAPLRMYLFYSGVFSRSAKLPTVLSTQATCSIILPANETCCDGAS